MKTIKYCSHSIQKTDGKYITSKRETELILGMLYQGIGSFTIDGKLVTVEGDHIKDGCRVTTVSVGD